MNLPHRIEVVIVFVKLTHTVTAKFSAEKNIYSAQFLYKCFVQSSLGENFVKFLFRRLRRPQSRRGGGRCFWVVRGGDA